jgi:hypothetical protein
MGMEAGNRMERQGSQVTDEIPSVGTALAALVIVACLIVAAAAGMIEWRLNHKDESTEVLSRTGYSEVVIGRYGWFRCNGMAEPFATRFSAIDQKGVNVRGTVCTDWHSNSTVKLD